MKGWKGTAASLTTRRLASGHRAAHNVRSEAEVDEVTTAPEGARHRRPARGQDVLCGYAGHFTDLDGHVWQISPNPGFPPAEDGSITIPDASSRSAPRPGELDPAGRVTVPQHDRALGLSTGWLSRPIGVPQGVCSTGRPHPCVVRRTIDDWGYVVGLRPQAETIGGGREVETAGTHVG